MTTESARLRCFRSDFLNLIILPTEACNFRCSYCYEKFEHKKMPKRVVTGIKSLIDRCGGDLNELQISWFGGEPLLAYDVVSEISRHAANVAKSKNFAFAADMTTNGYFLNRNQFVNCLDHEIRSFQISFDGDEQTHNSSRKLASGAGTFEKIWANIMEISKVADRFKIVLRLNYTLEIGRAHV